MSQESSRDENGVNAACEQCLPHWRHLFVVSIMVSFSFKWAFHQYSPCCRWLPNDFQRVPRCLLVSSKSRTTRLRGARGQRAPTDSGFPSSGPRSERPERPARVNRHTVRTDRLLLPDGAITAHALTVAGPSHPVSPFARRGRGRSSPTAHEDSRRGGGVFRADPRRAGL